MRTGYIISGVGHAGLIGYLLVGPIFSADPPPFEDVEVSVISSAEFDALTNQTPPETPTQITAPEAVVAPPPEPTPEPAPQPVPEPVRPQTPEPVRPTPPPDATPDVSQIAPLPQTDVTDEAPQEPTPPAPPPEPQVSAVIDASKRPKARPAPRIAPQAVAPPPLDATIADQTQEAVVETNDPDALPRTQSDAQQATAPEEAAPEVVTEAEEAGGAPTRSIRPPARPNRPVAPVQAAQSEVASEADAAAQTAETTDAAPASDAPVGPPMTQGERQSLVGQIQNKWAVPPRVISDQVVITVRFAVGEDRRPISGSEELISGSGSADLNQIAYRAARSAIFRAGAQGFDLPDDKYDQWKDIEITFNPSGLRLK